MKAILFIIRYIYALAASIYLFTLGFLSARNRSLILTICDYFGYRRPRPELAIPKVKFSRVWDASAPLCLDALEHRDGNITDGELVTIANIVRQIKALRIFEIGTFDGRTALNIAMNCPEEAKVYTLDLPKNRSGEAKLPLLGQDSVYIDKDIIGSRFRGKPCAEKIIQLYGDSATYDFSAFYGSMDLVFIDGSHSYEYILNDSAVALKLRKDAGSTIIWHDYGGSWEEVIRALNELYGREDGVFKGLRHIEGTSLVILPNDLFRQKIAVT